MAAKNCRASQSVRLWFTEGRAIQFSNVVLLVTIPPMHWLQILDTNLFLFFNRSLVNPLFDWLMPVLSGSGGAKNVLIAVAVLIGVLMFVFGKQRARVCVLMLAMIVGTNDGLICNTLKHAISRPRPFVTLPETRLYGQVGKEYIPPVLDKNGVNLAANLGSHNSMPSAHAANWFCATMVLFLFYRRSLWFMLPMALAVSFSVSTTACIIQAICWLVR